MVLDGLDVTIKARLQVQRAWTGDGEHDVAAFGHQLQPPGRDVVPGLVKRLSHVAQTLVWAAGRHVGVITDHRDAGGESVGCRRVERPSVDNAHSDTNWLSAKRGPHAADHLRYDTV